MLGNSTTPEDIFRLPIPFQDPLRRRFFSLAGRSVERLLALRACGEIYSRLSPGEDDSFPERALEALGISIQVSESDLGNIPATGPVVVVANHPFGAVEGLMLAALLRRIRPDVRIMANYLLGRIPQMRPMLIQVDPFGAPGSPRANVRPLRESLRWLVQGGLLALFPAGEVSHLHLQRRDISDPPWSDTLAGLVRRSRATVLPVFFRGGNGPLFQMAGLVHPRLRTAFLPHQLLNKRGRTLPVRIGTPIPFRKLESFSGNRELTDYLRFRTYLLEQSAAPGNRSPSPAGPSAPLSVAPPEDPALLAAEIDRLPPEQILVESGACTVFQAEAWQIPRVLEEIGRLREVTFRAVGEGTGKALDLDRFDEDYLHIFSWNRGTREIVGAYRIGRTDDLLKRKGLRGLYTSTLFKLHPRLLKTIDPALELGRSFVRPEYQKSYAPLLLLWKGIGRFVLANPRYRLLFGPVSISSEYSAFSRQLMVRSLRQSRFIPELARLVRPRVPLQLRPLRIRGCDSRLLRSLCADPDEISAAIAEVEADQKGIPVLLRHYLNLGGKLLAFNVDPDFSNVLDGLTLVDLAQTEPKALERYLGKEGARAFIDYHQETSGLCA